MVDVAKPLVLYIVLEMWGCEIGDRRERERGMTRFSLGGDEDGEGPSSPRLKRRRLVLGTAATIAIGDRRRGGGLQAVEEDESASSESEEEEDESESEEEEESEGDQEHQRQLRTNFELGSASAAQQIALASTTTATDRSLSITLADPDVLDCPICCESLTVPVFQVSSHSCFQMIILSLE